MQTNLARRLYRAAMASAAASDPTRVAVDAVMKSAMKSYFLKGAIVQVRSDGNRVHGDLR